VTRSRRAARVLLVADDAVLLLEGRDPGRADAQPFWMTPGGGVEPGEPVEAAACREVLEETGLALGPGALGSVVATRTASFTFDGVDYEQSESFFAVTVDRFAPTRAGWEGEERRMLTDFRWWTVDELEATAAAVYPRELVELLRTLRAARPERPLLLSGD